MTQRWTLFAAIFFLLNIATAGWAQFNQPATTVQLPTFGVAVDPDGLLTSTAVGDPGRRKWMALRAAAFRKLPGDLRHGARLRFVSLRGINEEVLRLAAMGAPVPDEIRRLAGLTRVEFVFCCPNLHDILLAGPAEPWADDLTGHAIGLETGAPVVNLEDLAAALRVFPPGLAGPPPFLGCTIDPQPDSLIALQEFQRTIPRVVSNRQRGQVTAYTAEGTAKALGNANIRVFGVSPQSHFAMVMVEADYAMKRIGIGLEPPPVKMATFVSALKSAPQSTLQRWWFTPKYDRLTMDADGLSLQLAGQAVGLSAEGKQVDDAGRLLDTGRPAGRALQLYAQAFTAKYPEIAAARPVYGQLRNLIDLSVVAAVICRADWYARSGLTLDGLMDERKLAIQRFHAPKQVPCPVNVVWKGSRMLALAGGGVQWNPDEGLAKDLRHVDPSLSQRRPATIADGRWWWDAEQEK